MNVLGDSKSSRTESVNDRTDQCGTWSEWLEVVEKLQVFQASSNLHSLTIKNSCFAEQKSLQSFSTFLVSGISLKSCLSFALNLNFITMPVCCEEEKWLASRRYCNLEPVLEAHDYLLQRSSNHGLDVSMFFFFSSEWSDASFDCVPRIPAFLRKYGCKYWRLIICWNRFDFKLLSSTI